MISRFVVRSMLSPELTKLFIEGPTPAQKAKRLVMYGGFAVLHVLWHKHRDSLMALCEPGKRPWGFWALEKRLKPTPISERAQLQAIRNLDCYRNNAEREHVHQRLVAISDEPPARRHVRRVA
jgi:hypothetical protein